MKKVFVLIAVIVAGITASAQQKGNFSVGGSIGVTGGTERIPVAMKEFLLPSSVI